MNKAVLHSVIADALDGGVVTIENWRRLRSEVLADGLTCREEADLLIALDRSDVVLPDGWADGLTAAVVEYAVWTERRTGRRPSRQPTASPTPWLLVSRSRTTAATGISNESRRRAVRSPRTA